jgi:hypothetical protein
MEKSNNKSYSDTLSTANVIILKQIITELLLKTDGMGDNKNDCGFCVSADMDGT